MLVLVLNRYYKNQFLVSMVGKVEQQEEFGNILENLDIAIISRSNEDAISYANWNGYKILKGIHEKVN